MFQSNSRIGSINMYRIYLWIGGNKMKKTFRYTVNVFIADKIQSNNSIIAIEFNEITSNYRISYSDSEENDKQTVRIDIILKANDLKKALYEAKNVLEDKLAIISFLFMFPCRIINQGSVDCMESEDGTIEWMVEPTIQTMIYPSFRLDDVNMLFHHPDEKITNSLRWFRKGLLENNLYDRFITLWIAFEMISSKLKPSDKKYLRCPRCTQIIDTCPICGKKTDTKPMEKDGIIHHINTNLAITDPGYYSRLNNMRNAIFHGRIREITPEDAKTEIEKLKYCLFTSYYFLIYGSIPENESDIVQRFRFLFQEFDVNAVIKIKEEAVHETEKNNKRYYVDIKKK